jgi:magnesium transporter
MDQEVKFLALLDTCDTIKSSLESSTNLFFPIQGHRMNQVIRTLPLFRQPSFLLLLLQGYME